MKRYFLGFVFVVAVSVLVTRQYEKYTRDAAAERQNGGNAAISVDNSPNPTADAEEAERNHPRWYLSYLIFGWPNGITVWALFATMMVIAEQTRETRGAAIATRDSAEASRQQVQQMIVQTNTAQVAAGTALEQLRAMQIQTDEIARQVNLMEDTAKRQLRAYICTDTMWIQVRGVGQIVAHVNIKNSGQTPAHEVQGWIGIEVGSYPLSMALAKPLDAGIQHPRQSLGAGGTTEFVVPLERQLSHVELNDLETGKSAAFVYGQVTYKDIFRDQWFTCYRLVAGGLQGVRSTRTASGELQWMLGPDTEGNDAT